MRQIDTVGVGSLPTGLSPGIPGIPAGCRTRLTEHDRLQWWCADGGDPARLLEDFLAGHGLPVRDLARPAAPHPDVPRPGTVCGAGVFVSAAAGATMVRGAVGPPSPAPAVPDLVAVVYRHTTPSTSQPGDPDTWPAAPTGWRLGPWQPSWTGQAHAAAVEQARAAIGRGDIYQVNVVGHAAARYDGNPGPALARVARLPGARYGGVLTGPGWAIGCASPETLVEATAGRVTTRPIKGTRPATDDGRRDMLTSAKERAEHIMIVDLERNDLARVARTGSVHVDDLYTLRRWSGLWQAESTVSAQLADGCGLADLLRAVCPGGSVTGAPKLAALAEIAALEPVGRGAAMGGFGWIDANGLDLGLTIRTVAVDADRVHVWAGGGITWDSDPHAEVAEAAAKAGPVRAALAG
ncbi:chorismate-binding protein [Plantactinospora sp. B24E8]|uniref:chorismate-binding protein n=1 Tax=Plantactinospora sp. B24E8 TaxID=3153567 RepID=UPI00325C9553